MDTRRAQQGSIATRGRPLCPQDWPCSTYRVVAEWARAPLPDGDMPGSRYRDEDWKPWDGKPWQLPRPESFVHLDSDDIGGME